MASGRTKTVPHPFDLPPPLLQEEKLARTEGKEGTEGGKGGKEGEVVMRSRLPLPEAEVLGPMLPLPEEELVVPLCASVRGIVICIRNSAEVQGGRCVSAGAGN